ncbi:MAG: oleate hydratase [Patescibacteria group bacterium]
MSQIYLVGGGIASLASAVYLIKDGKIAGKDIFIFDEAGRLGGSLDAEGSAKNGYMMQGYRMFEEKIYSCTLDLLSHIPGVHLKSVKDEILAFNEKNLVHSKSRLVENGKILNTPSLGLSWKIRSEIFTLMARNETTLGSSQIKDYFTPAFFKTDFWLEFCTTFAFKPQDSLAELRRYFLRFIQESPHINLLTGVRSTPYNQYESIVLPIYNYLSILGVNFKTKCQVTHLDFEKKNAKHLYYTHDKKSHKITLSKNDLVLVTAGSMIANFSIGSMTSAPILNLKKPTGAWTLWENMAKHHRDFGRPTFFTSQPNKTKLESFTITFKNKIFIKLLEKLTGNKAGEQGLITFKNSNWLMTVVLPKQPHFINQPKKVVVAWGYALYPDKKGNFVSRKMSECTGEEILTELCLHLGFEKELTKILKNSICLPCLMPYGASQFLPRRRGDRPAVVPKGSTNFAFTGQFCEIPEEIAFTVEYSIRSAQIAVYTLLNLAKKVTPIYHGQNNIKVLFDAFKASLK